MSFIVTVLNGSEYGYFDEQFKVVSDYRQAKHFDSVEDAERFISEHKTDWRSIIRVETDMPF